MTIERNDIWQEGYKIPWNDPDFSRRMLREHLSQTHDLASRKTESIDRQVDWIHHVLLCGRRSRILDLGCGPGLYSHRFCRRGHDVTGIDFGPASIEYANEHNPDADACRFELGDIRRVPFGGPFELVMLLYGEMNVFSPSEIQRILQKANQSLVPGGTLIIEPQVSASVEKSGRADVIEQECESGLFDDGPYTLRVESQWLDDQLATIQTFIVTKAGGDVDCYRSTTKAWQDKALISLLEGAGFSNVVRQANWPGNTPDLILWSSAKASDVTS